MSLCITHVHDSESGLLALLTPCSLVFIRHHCVEVVIGSLSAGSLSHPTQLQYNGGTRGHKCRQCLLHLRKKKSDHTSYLSSNISHRRAVLSIPCLET